MEKNFSIDYITKDNKLNPFLLEKLIENKSYYLFYNNKTNEYDAYLSTEVDKVNYYLRVLVFKYKDNLKTKYYLISERLGYLKLENLTYQLFKIHE